MEELKKMLYLRVKQYEEGTPKPSILHLHVLLHVARSLLHVFDAGPFLLLLILNTLVFFHVEYQLNLILQMMLSMEIVIFDVLLN